MKRLPFLLATALVVFSSVKLLAASLPEEAWPQFRGPQARGVAMSTNLPDHWSATENVAWKAEISGRGWSCPIVWGDRVFLTTAISSAEVEPAKKGLYFGGERKEPLGGEQEWKLLCLKLHTGKSQWEQTLHRGRPAGPIHIKNSYASETPATDGERVYAYIGNVGAFAFDFLGHLVWSKMLEPHKIRAGWGTASSPTLDGDRLYVVNDNDEQSYLLALDKRTGKEIWRAERDEKSNWSTPFVWQNGKRTEIVTAGTGKVRSYDLDGKLLWWLKGMSSITIATPYAEEDLLYVTSGFVMDKSRPIYAIKPGANGDISLEPGQTNNNNIAWCKPAAAPYNPTTLVYDRVLYVLYDGGLLSAFDARTGVPFYTRERLPEGLHFTASPWAANGRIFCLNEDGMTFVVQAGQKFEVLHTNKLAEDDMCMASPALIGDRLLIRTAVRVYCFKRGA